MLGMDHMRCTLAATERLRAAGACFHYESWRDEDEPLWKYMQCLHPNELEGGMMMHSYVYIGGEYVGNGVPAARGEGAPRMTHAQHVHVHRHVT